MVGEQQRGYNLPTLVDGHTGLGCIMCVDMVGWGGVGVGVGVGVGGVGVGVGGKQT